MQQGLTQGFGSCFLENFPLRINKGKWTLKVTYQELIEVKIPGSHGMPMW